ncbi:hypothetical protein F66182_7718, partial [Fusarium sp. NRRL 66182]
MKAHYFIFRIITGILCPVLAAAVVSSDAHQAHWDLSTSLNGFSFERARAFAASAKTTSDSASIRVSRLKNLGVKAESYTKSVHSLLARSNQAKPGEGTYQNISALGGFSTAYGIQCSWDGMPAWFVFDTGSADTWAAKTGFKCEDSAGDAHEQASCAFGQPQIEGFGHGEVPEVHFHRQYSSGEAVSGPMGFSDISCGGISVSKQQVGLANRTHWHGNNVTIGILGLAYPSLTSAYLGELGDEPEWNNLPYTPWLTTAIAQGKTNPMFSVSIERNTSDGVLTWGGLPPMPWQPKSVAATDLII